jgi:hypothetical protein
MRPGPFAGALFREYARIAMEMLPIATPRTRNASGQLKAVLENHLGLPPKPRS